MHCFDYKGRARRKDLWCFTLFELLVVPVILVTPLLLIDIKNSSEEVQTISFAVIIILYAILTIPAEIALKVRRLHDIGKSGWWMFIIFIPFYIGAIILYIWWLFYNSQPGHNQYGPNPKGIGNDVYGNPYQG